MTRLSVNINKIALIRNARGGNVPDIIKAAGACERYGAQGITVHPRPDERHIRYHDVQVLKPAIKTELNVEGFPSKKFLNLVKKIKPHQVTLVPDPPDALTSNAGWDTVKNASLLRDTVQQLKSCGIRTSIFIGTDLKMIEHARHTGTQRVELYTEPYSRNFHLNRKKAIAPFIRAANLANQLGLGINAGHDLNLENLNFFVKNIPFLHEVSIGHALVSDALYYGLERTIGMYLKELSGG
ncbi:MAG: pyridoxine 5'-phosphate synthase [Bacteroidetes bacterium]|nr:pyridoxine 5'-phosphate synthase [Bacteroidota bacterium]